MRLALLLLIGAGLATCEHPIATGTRAKPAIALKSDTLAGTPSLDSLLRPWIPATVTPILSGDSLRRLATKTGHVVAVGMPDGVTMPLPGYHSRLVLANPLATSPFFAIDLIDTERAARATWSTLIDVEANVRPANARGLLEANAMPWRSLRLRTFDGQFTPARSAVDRRPRRYACLAVEREEQLGTVRTFCMLRAEDLPALITVEGAVASSLEAASGPAMLDAIARAYVIEQWVHRRVH